MEPFWSRRSDSNDSRQQNCVSVGPREASQDKTLLLHFPFNPPRTSWSQRQSQGFCFSQSKPEYLLSAEGKCGPAHQVTGTAGDLTLVELKPCRVVTGATGWTQENVSRAVLKESRDV